MDPNRTVDPRIQRTHALLLSALTELLHEKTFDEIRVKDICQRAMIHRSTFYTHFEDKRHLLTFGIQEFIDLLTDRLPCSENPAPFRQAIGQIFQYFFDRCQAYSKLFLNPRNAEAKEIFLDEFTRVLTAQTLSHPAYSFYQREEIVVLCQFFAGGLLAVICWWLKDPHRVSVDAIADHFCSTYLFHVPSDVLIPRDPPAPS